MLCNILVGGLKKEKGLYKFPDGYIEANLLVERLSVKSIDSFTAKINCWCRGTEK